MPFGRWCAAVEQWHRQGDDFIDTIDRNFGVTDAFKGVAGGRVTATDEIWANHRKPTVRAPAPYPDRGTLSAQRALDG